MIDGSTVQIIGQDFAAQAADQLRIIADHFFIRQSGQVQGCPDMEPRLAGILQRQRIQVQAKVIADDTVEILPIKPCLQNSVLLGSPASFFRLLADVQILEGVKP